MKNDGLWFCDPIYYACLTASYLLYRYEDGNIGRMQYNMRLQNQKLV